MLNDIPREIITVIFSFLDQKTLTIKCTILNKYIRNVVLENTRRTFRVSYNSPVVLFHFKNSQFKMVGPGLRVPRRLKVRHPSLKLEGAIKSKKLLSKISETNPTRLITSSSGLLSYDLSGLASLTSLTLEYESVLTRSEGCLRHFTNLKHFSLLGNGPTECDIECLTKLESIALISTPIKTLSQVKLRGLRKLKLKFNELSNLTQLVSLTSLSTWSKVIRPEDLLPLTNLRKLKLYSAYIQLSNADFTHLTNLEILGCRCQNNITISILDEIPSLQEFYRFRNWVE